MSFDKVKAMRDAERFLTQGKIRAAISEYKRVVDFDKTDFNTLNMLGDLYVKASETDEAVKCFSLVAEHYSIQGFAQKAIAIYNKILRLKPNSMDVSAKLAQLYQAKGSYAEARNHYTVLAEQYTKNGKKAEALNVWKQIASLDPYNTDIYFKIAEACWQDQQKDEAANAYIEAGNRLTKKNQFESAITAFARALEIRPDDLPALRGFAKSQIGLGSPDEAARTLESSFARQPHNREITNLLADCYIEAGKVVDAEKTVVKLVEQEPTQYSKLLEVFQAYIKLRDVESAGRVLTVASEHMLVGGRAIELEQKINEILDLNPDALDGIRLLVRFHSWQRDETGIKTSFEKLAEAAKNNGVVEDEIYALSQLVMIAPQNVYFAQRLQELNLANGNGFFHNPQVEEKSKSDVPTYESYTNLSDEDISISETETGFDFIQQDEVIEEQSQFYEKVGGDVAEVEQSVESAETLEDYRQLTEFEKHGLQNELEGIDFYIEQGFLDLAEKTLDEIEGNFGNQPEIRDLRELLATLASSKDESFAADSNQTKVESPTNSAQTFSVENYEKYQTNELEEAYEKQVIEEISNSDLQEIESADHSTETENLPSEETTENLVAEDSAVENEAVESIEEVQKELVDESIEIAETVETESVELSEKDESSEIPETLEKDENIAIKEEVEISETLENTETFESAEKVDSNVSIEIEETVSELNQEADTIDSTTSIEPEKADAELTKTEEVEQLFETKTEEVETASVQVENAEVEQNEEVANESNLVANLKEEEVESTPSPQINPLDELKSELSSPESELVSTQNEPYDDVFETSYQTGIVYREMGLIEDSIREFQNAIKRVTPDDGSRRFFLCCNMLGLCFMEKQMPTIAVMWLKQGLECNHLSDLEINGMRYELANAYDKAGDKEKAQGLFEQIYAVDVSFRDVGERLHSLIAA